MQFFFKLQSQKPILMHSMQQINMFESVAEIKRRIKLLAQQLEAGISRRNIRLDKTDNFNL